MRERCSYMARLLCAAGGTRCAWLPETDPKSCGDRSIRCLVLVGDSLLCVVERSAPRCLISLANSGCCPWADPLSSDRSAKSSPQSAGSEIQSFSPLQVQYYYALN